MPSQFRRLFAPALVFCFDLFSLCFTCTRPLLCHDVCFVPLPLIEPNKPSPPRVRVRPSPVHLVLPSFLNFFHLLPTVTFPQLFSSSSCSFLVRLNLFARQLSWDHTRYPFNLLSPCVPPLNPLSSSHDSSSIEPALGVRFRHLRLGIPFRSYVVNSDLVTQWIDPAAFILRIPRSCNTTQHRHCHDKDWCQELIMRAKGES